MKQNIPTKWFKISVLPNDKPSDVTRKLVEKGIDLSLLPYSVYVIRLSGSFTIDYKNGPSPTLYIGEGKFRGRLNAHRKWLGRLHSVLEATPLEVKFCFPRTIDGTPANRELEAHLLTAFKAKFLELPLQNMQKETPSKILTFNSKSNGHVIGPGAGKKFLWALRPMKRNPFKYQKNDA